MSDLIDELNASGLEAERMEKAIRVTTPLLDPARHLIEVYLVEQGDRRIWSDYGGTVREVFMQQGAADEAPEVVRKTMESLDTPASRQVRFDSGHLLRPHDGYEITPQQAWELAQCIVEVFTVIGQMEVKQ